MSQSSRFTARMMKEQKMFAYNPPPGIGFASFFIIGVCILLQSKFIDDGNKRDN